MPGDDSLLATGWTSYAAFSRRRSGLAPDRQHSLRTLPRAPAPPCLDFPPQLRHDLG